MSPSSSSGTRSSITASVPSPALTITMTARGRWIEATKSSSDSLPTKLPSSPNSSTRAVIREVVRLCTAIV